MKTYTVSQLAMDKYIAMLEENVNYCRNNNKDKSLHKHLYVAQNSVSAIKKILGADFADEEAVENMIAGVENMIAERDP